ncbi:MAG: ABC transporter ATP-binding protein [Sporolactobacillus sp.]
MLSVTIEAGGYSVREPLLRDICFSVQPGELVGLIGPNGAGKSTTLKALRGTLPYLRGSVQLSPYGYVPERPLIYERLTLQEHLDFLQTTLGGDEAPFAERARRLLQCFQLTDAIHRFPDQFSKGMQQKMMLVLAFLRRADCYLIDEPFIGLDPHATKQLLHVIAEEKARGAAILMTTHVLDAAERVCDRFILINGGRLIVQGTLAVLRQASGLHEGTLLDCFDVLTAGHSDES